MLRVGTKLMRDMATRRAKWALEEPQPSLWQTMPPEGRVEVLKDLVAMLDAVKERTLNLNQDSKWEELEGLLVVYQEIERRLVRQVSWIEKEKDHEQAEE